MPLSEDEQRILRQIEEQFYESDPKFAQQSASRRSTGTRSAASAGPVRA